MTTTLTLESWTRLYDDPDVRELLPAVETRAAAQAAKQHRSEVTQIDLILAVIDFLRCGKGRYAALAADTGHNKLIKLSPVWVGPGECAFCHAEPNTKHTKKPRSPILASDKARIEVKRRAAVEGVARYGAASCGHPNLKGEKCWLPPHTSGDHKY